MECKHWKNGLTKILLFGNRSGALIIDILPGSPMVPGSAARESGDRQGRVATSVKPSVNAIKREGGNVRNST